MNFASPSFAAVVAAYQVLCTHLEALQEQRAEMAARDASDDDALTASLRIVRQARIARRHLHDLLCDLIAVAVRNGEPRSAIVDHLQSDLDALVAQHTLRPDAGLVDEITTWALEAYAGERSKADYAETW
jgi:hypothetical protein